jgi:hypothetical protein
MECGDSDVVLCVLRVSDTKGKDASFKIEESLARTRYIAPKPTSGSGTAKGYLIDPDLAWIAARGRLVDPHRVEYAIVRSWMQDCQSKHKGPCLGKGSPQSSSMKLINCNSRRLEQASFPCTYLALSYVWGQVDQAENASQLSNGVLPLSLPRTVEDAIAVTKALGYVYLWVDKYCINQADAKERWPGFNRWTLFI